jgi:hypothetical protein
MPSGMPSELHTGVLWDILLIRLELILGSLLKAQDPDLRWVKIRCDTMCDTNLYLVARSI